MECRTRAALGSDNPYKLRTCRDGHQSISASASWGVSWGTEFGHGKAIGGRCLGGDDKIIGGGYSPECEIRAVPVHPGSRSADPTNSAGHTDYGPNVRHRSGLRPESRHGSTSSDFTCRHSTRSGNAVREHSARTRIFNNDWSMLKNFHCTDRIYLSSVLIFQPFNVTEPFPPGIECGPGRP